MEWVVAVQYDGVRAEHHGPVTPIDDERIRPSSVMSCGEAYTTMTYIVTAESEEQARALATKQAARYATEVGLGPGPTLVDASPVENKVPS